MLTMTISEWKAETTNQTSFPCLCFLGGKILRLSWSSMWRFSKIFCLYFISPVTLNILSEASNPESHWRKAGWPGMKFKFRSKVVTVTPTNTVHRWEAQFIAQEDSSQQSLCSPVPLQHTYHRLFYTVQNCRDVGSSRTVKVTVEIGSFSSVLIHVELWKEFFFCQYLLQ